MEPTPVVVVEDDEAIGEPLARRLGREGYSVTLATDGPSGLEAGLAPGVAVVLLDVGLPGIDGVEVCRRLREERAHLQILVVTALGGEAAAVAALDAGADDFVIKPFRLPELLARVRSAARRADPELVVIGALRVDRGSRTVTVDGSDVALTPKEFDLLERLALGAGTVVGREQLLRDVWGSPWIGSGRTLDQHVSWLRQKVPGLALVTVRGRGYRLEEAG